MTTRTARRLHALDAVRALRPPAGRGLPRRLLSFMPGMAARPVGDGRQLAQRSSSHDAAFVAHMLPHVAVLLPRRLLRPAAAPATGHARLLGQPRCSASPCRWWSAGCCCSRLIGLVWYLGISKTLRRDPPPMPEMPKQPSAPSRSRTCGSSTSCCGSTRRAAAARRRRALRPRRRLRGAVDRAWSGSLRVAWPVAAARPAGGAGAAGAAGLVLRGPASRRPTRPLVPQLPATVGYGTAFVLRLAGAPQRAMRWRDRQRCANPLAGAHGAAGPRSRAACATATRCTTGSRQLVRMPGHGTTLTKADLRADRSAWRPGPGASRFTGAGAALPVRSPEPRCAATSPTRRTGSTWRTCRW
jgi:hypothetical protein